MERQQENGQTEEREQLMQAAEKLVLEVGLSELTPEVLRQEAGLSEAAFREIFDSLEQAGTPALQQLLLRFEDETDKTAPLNEQFEYFLVKAIQLAMDNGLDFIRTWIRGSLHMEETYGMSIVFTFWDILGRFFERAIEEGVLNDDTPVDRLVSIVSAEFFGTSFCWCIMKGTEIHPVSTIRNYCRRDLPILLTDYQTAS